jgi:hypothetical protein
MNINIILLLTTLHDLLYPPLKGFSQIKIDLPKPARGVTYVRGLGKVEILKI